MFKLMIYDKSNHLKSEEYFEDFDEMYFGLQKLLVYDGLNADVSVVRVYVR